MSSLFQFERNIEDAVGSYLGANGLPAFTTRSVHNLPLNNIQVALQYMGSNEGMRQRIGEFQEYDLHEGELMLLVSTERVDAIAHHSRIGQVRALLLNSQIDFSSAPYTIFDIKPEQTVTLEQEENNLDQSTLSYSIKWKVNLDNL